MVGEMTLSAAQTGEVTKKTLPPVSCKDASTPGSRQRAFKLKHRIIFGTPGIRMKW